MIKLIIAGAAGRMGMSIAALASQDKDIQLLYGLESMANVNAYRGSVPNYTVGADASQIGKADVLIDFTTPEATMNTLLPFVRKYGKPYVLGTTGFNVDQEAEIKELSTKIPLIKSPNMSLGVNVFFKLAQETARALTHYNVEITEAHHKHKKDSPSGTALYVGDVIEKITGKSVRYQSIREGEIVGDHRVIFTGPSERLELFHHADSRDTFAAGALVAAKWVVKQQPGLYTMKDVLGL